MSFKVLANVPGISPQQMNASQMSLPGPETSSKLCESFPKRSAKMTITHKRFENNSNFHMKYRTKGKV